MSQHMEYEQSRNQSQEQPQFDTYDAGYKDPFAGSYNAQKVTATQTSGSNASAGMRLALAIVSLGILVPISGIVLGISTGAGGPFGFFGALIIMAIICVTIIAVNITFNIRR